MLASLVLCVSVVASTPAVSLPLPPPTDKVLQQQQAFFRALPKRLPVEDLQAFTPHVVPDVKVYSEGTVTHSTREEWFAYLQSFGQVRPNGPRGITVRREEFYVTRDGDIIVLEFSSPIPPKGKEGQISYHEDYDLQFVSYRLDNGRLTRVDYGKRMRRYDQWLKEEATAIPPFQRSR
jgi:hypothetical protein